MTTARNPALHVVQVKRSRWWWPVGYFEVLLGARIAFLLDDGSPACGTLEGVRESEEWIELSLSDVGPED